MARRSYAAPVTVPQTVDELVEEVVEEAAADMRCSFITVLLQQGIYEGIRRRMLHWPSRAQSTRY